VTSPQIHAEHDHRHGDSCGHVSFQHGDHTDYAHDGHVHRQGEGGGWEECRSQGHTGHESHEHVHQEGCGHVAVPHDGHTDYVHEGHRHARHDDHWDEH
jgi:hypothetical protein